MFMSHLRPDQVALLRKQFPFVVKIRIQVQYEFTQQDRKALPVYKQTHGNYTVFMTPHCYV